MVSGTFLSAPPPLDVTPVYGPQGGFQAELSPFICNNGDWIKATVLRRDVIQECQDGQQLKRSMPGLCISAQVRRDV